MGYDNWHDDTLGTEDSEGRVLQNKDQTKSPLFTVSQAASGRANIARQNINTSTLLAFM
jgi:hypothetical protein